MLHIQNITFVGSKAAAIACNAVSAHQSAEVLKILEQNLPTEQMDRAEHRLLPTSKHASNIHVMCLCKGLRGLYGLSFPKSEKSHMRVRYITLG